MKQALVVLSALFCGCVEQTPTRRDPVQMMLHCRASLQEYADAAGLTLHDVSDCWPQQNQGRYLSCLVSVSFDDENVRKEYRVICPTGAP